MASSLDGMIGLDAFESDANRESYGFGGPADHAVVKQYLQTADAVITGANSIRAARRTWEVCNHNGKFADWIVLTQNGLDPTLEFFQQSNVHKILVSPERLKDFQPSSHCENKCYGKNFSDFFGRLFVKRNYANVLLFGGGNCNKIFYANGLVDYLSLTLCPVILARSGASRLVQEGLDAYIRLSYQSSQAVENLVFLKYKVIKN